MSNPESQNNLEPDTNYIKFGVSSKTLENLNGKAGAVWLHKSTAELVVKLYPDESWGGAGIPVEGQAGTCVVPQSSGAKSIELAWQNPGVYLCKADGKTCSVYSGSQPKLANGFEGKVAYIRFKNPYTYDSSIPAADCTAEKGRTYFSDQQTCGYYTQRYGAILHEGKNYTATCDVFLGDGTSPVCTNSPNTSCQEKGTKKASNYFPGGGVSSITVFLQSQPGEIPQGTGVALFENVSYNEGNPGGQITLEAGDYSNFSQRYFDSNPSKTSNIKDRVSSIKIDGNFIALLFHQTDYHGRCEVFKGDDPNLNKNTGNSIIDEDAADSAKVIIIKK